VGRRYPIPTPAAFLVLPLLLVLLIVGFNSPAAAAVVVESVNGRAVLEGSADRARTQAVDAALRRALRRYVFEEQGISPKFEKKVNQEIISDRNRFIRSYEILRERTLGDLYQVELKVELRADLIDQVLAGIEQKHKQRVEHLVLAQLPPVRMEGAAPAAPVLESSLLLTELQGELQAYGFSLEAAGPLSAELKVMLSRVLADSGDGSGGRLDAGVFKGLLPGDLIIVVRSSPADEEKIVSLDKSLWKARAELAFIDLRNGRIIRLPPVNAKVINQDYVAGLKELTRTLTGRVKDACLDRLLRDYVIPERKKTEVVLECRGFPRPADFALFRQRLEALRSVSGVRIQALAAGLIELRLELVTPPRTLVAWINSFKAPDFPGRLTAYAAGGENSPVVVRVECDAAVPGD
jgi:hypothetical protein